MIPERTVLNTLFDMSVGADWLNDMTSREER